MRVVHAQRTRMSTTFLDSTFIPLWRWAPSNFHCACYDDLHATDGNSCSAPFLLWDVSSLASEWNHRRTSSSYRTMFALHRVSSPALYCWCHWYLKSTYMIMCTWAALNHSRARRDCPCVEEICVCAVLFTAKDHPGVSFRFPVFYSRRGVPARSCIVPIHDHRSRLE